MKTIYLKVTYDETAIADSDIGGVDCDVKSKPTDPRVVDELQSILEYAGVEATVTHFASDIPTPEPVAQGDGDGRPLAAQHASHDFTDFHGEA